MKIKKILAIDLAIMMLFSLTACNKTNTGVEDTLSSITSERTYDETDPTAVLGEITNDFADTTTALTTKLEETFVSVGTTYKDYKKNKGLVDEWVKLALSESDALFARTKKNSIVYFKLIANDPDHKYSEFCEEAMDEYYDSVYDKALDEYYDTLYDNAMDDLYDEYYDGIIDDAYDDLEYEEWSDASSECYKTWSDANSAVYKKWSDESSYIYGLWSSVYSAFCYNKNFDVDSIVAEYETKKAEDDAERAEKEAKVYSELHVLYEINSNGDAEVVGFTGEGNQITISAEYEGADVVRIADAAFENCAMLENIIMWADIEEIGDSAFKGCTGLTEFSVPNDTEVIGHHAFEGCSNLENLIIWGSPDIGEYAFADCVSLTDISISNDTQNIGAHAFEGCTGVTSLIIWGVENIGDYAFAGCSGIEDVSFPNDVLSIGNHAFDGCTALSSVIVWDDDTAIGEDAFANCPKLKDAPSSTMGDAPHTANIEAESREISSFQFVVGGVELSVPSYYEIENDTTDEDETQFSANTGDNVALFLMSIYVTQERYQAMEDSIADTFLEGSSFENPELLSSDDILLAGFPGTASAYKGNFEGIPATVHMAFAFNTNTSEVILSLLVQAGSPQYDYIADAEKMLETAVPVKTEETGPHTSQDGVRPEFKSAMDSYEAFYEEYCAFMKQYSANPTDLTLFSKYTDMMTKASEVDEKFEAWDDEDLNDAELKYYMEVYSRITSKLLDAIG